MRDKMKSCQHTLTDDAEYKEVVVIGNGPSGLVTSFMLAGNVPYLKQIPEDLPIDEMLRARLSNIPPGQSLYETDLMELAEGLEGRSQNPIPLLMDNLLRPCADMGIEADSLLEWRHEPNKEIDHVVLGSGLCGGSWWRFGGVVALSPAGWLALPPHRAAAATPRAPARTIAAYFRRYVARCRLQRYMRCGVMVTRVTSLPPRRVDCPNPACPLKARFCVSGYVRGSGSRFRYACGRVVISAGGGGRPRLLAPLAATALHDINALERAVQAQAPYRPVLPSLVVGSGLSAADAVRVCRSVGPVLHVHRRAADALAQLPRHQYPEYYEIYKMMMDGPEGNHENYTPYPDHVVVSVTPLTNDYSETQDDIQQKLQPKLVKLLNLANNQVTEVIVSLITVQIGWQPDLSFLQTNFDVTTINPKCKCIQMKPAKRKIEDDQTCFLKNHWHYLKYVLGQTVQICKLKYQNYMEVNGNDTNCDIENCKQPKCGCMKDDLKTKIEDKHNIIDRFNDKCCEESNPFTDGIGFGLDPTKPVDTRSNPIAIDKTTHEFLHGPKGMYALGPLTADNFIRFIPGGALAIVSHIHQEIKME